MSAPIIVVGHKNPDNDSISSAVLRLPENELARRAAGEGEPFQTYVPPAWGRCLRRAPGFWKRAVSPRPRSWVMCMRASET